MYLMCMVRHIGHVWQDIWAKHGTMYGVDHPRHLWSIHVRNMYETCMDHPRHILYMYSILYQNFMYGICMEHI